MAPKQPAGRGSPVTPIQEQQQQQQQQQQPPPPPPVAPLEPPDKTPRTNAATAAYAASVRGITAQAVAFYFRAPVKAFFRTRVDYLAHIRAIILEEQRLKAEQSVHAGAGAAKRPPALISPTSWLRSTTPAVLASAVHKFGWRIVPDHVLPPLVANVAVGAVLYTSYLQVLGRLHEQSAQHRSRVYPPPGPGATAMAGFAAGALQSVVAAPLDAIQARYDVQSAVGYAAASGGSRVATAAPATAATAATAAAAAAAARQSMWAFSVAKLGEIGLRGMFAGWGMSFAKDGVGSALFFSTFEYVKAQGYCRFVEWYYGSLSAEVLRTLAKKRPAIRHSLSSSSSSLSSPEYGDDSSPPAPTTTIRPHYALEPMFLLLAGVAASIVQQLVVYPLTHIQVEHWAHLEALDAQARRLRGRPDKYAIASARQWRMVRAYVDAYRDTMVQCRAGAAAARTSLRRWLYRGFWWGTIRQVPSTSAGLIIFELVRRRYGVRGGEVRIQQGDYDIILER